MKRDKIRPVTHPCARRCRALTDGGVDRWVLAPVQRLNSWTSGGNWLLGNLLKWIFGKFRNFGLIASSPLPKTQSSLKRSIVWDCGNLASSPWEWTCSLPPSTHRWAPPSCSWPTWQAPLSCSSPTCLATPPRNRSTSFAVPPVQVLCLCRCLPLLMALELLLLW